jgi:electron transfer flavoprotein alpha subunit
MPTLVVADHNNAALGAGTMNVVTAAAALDQDVHVLVAGLGASGVATAAAGIPGVAKILHCEDAAYEHGLAESLALLLVRLAEGYGAIVASTSSAAKAVMPRVAALLDVALISDISAVVSADTFVRPTYAGNAMATVRSSDPIKVITVRTSQFETAPDTGGSATIETVAAAEAQALSSFVSRDLNITERPELTSARVIISGGRGMASGDNFALLDAVAAKLNAAVGASRAAVDAGFVPNDYQVGQTGKIVAPQLYIAVGISGAIQHLAGMKDSKVIVAINKDEEAPIFQVADYGLVGDLFEVVPQLQQVI